MKPSPGPPPQPPPKPPILPNLSVPRPSLSPGPCQALSSGGGTRAASWGGGSANAAGEDSLAGRPVVTSSVEAGGAGAVPNATAVTVPPGPSDPPAPQDEVFCRRGEGSRLALGCVSRGGPWPWGGGGSTSPGGGTGVFFGLVAPLDAAGSQRCPRERWGHRQRPDPRGPLRPQHRGCDGSTGAVSVAPWLLRWHRPVQPGRSAAVPGERTPLRGTPGT